MVAARSVLCPIVVGRERELDVLGRRLDETAARNGGVVVVIVGEAGAGKSRLARESLARAEHAWLSVLSGRSVPEGAAVPYRPLTEAFLGASRGGGHPATPDLAGFEGHFGRLVPAWRVTTEAGIDESHHEPRARRPAADRRGVLQPGDRRWISFGHVESDECGSMNHWLAAAPNAEVVFNGLGCNVSLNDLADRPPRPMSDDERLDIGGHTIRLLTTPHVPHGWEAQVMFDEATRWRLRRAQRRAGAEGGLRRRRRRRRVDGAPPDPRAERTAWVQAKNHRREHLAKLPLPVAKLGLRIVGKRSWIADLAPLSPLR